MPELERIKIEGFKSISSIEVKPGGVNIVIGSNGSGKSNFIGVFSFLRAIREGRLQEYVAKAGGAERLLHYGSKTTKKLHIFLSFQDDVNQYRIDLQPTNTDELVPQEESGLYWEKKNYPRPMEVEISPQGKEAGISSLKLDDLLKYVGDHLDRWRVHHFHDTGADSPIKKTVDMKDNRWLREDGSNLAAFLYFLREKHTASYELIRDTVRGVAPFFNDFVLAPQKLNPDKIRLEWRHKGTDAYFDVSSFSDGTLRFIALTTLFLQPETYRPSVILVDEPELGLHPYAITSLASMIKQASVKTQVIASTQSPLLLDHFQPEDVLVADRVKGSTQLTRLDSNRLAAWLEEYSLGQLWEKNEIGGRPAREDGVR
jgi:predicted ATPase